MKTCPACYGARVYCRRCRTWHCGCSWNQCKAYRKTEYSIIERPAEGVLRARSRFGLQIFTRVKLRKNTECAACDTPIKKGDTAWSPITNGYNRMHRVCVACFGGEP